MKFPATAGLRRVIQRPGGNPVSTTATRVSKIANVCISLQTSDIDAVHAELTGQGVDVD